MAFALLLVPIILLSMVPICLAAPLVKAQERDVSLDTSESIEACETVSFIVKSSFFLNIGQQQRGVSEALLMQPYIAALTSLINCVKNLYPYENATANVCLTSIERSLCLSSDLDPEYRKLQASERHDSSARLGKARSDHATTENVSVANSSKLDLSVSRLIDNLTQSEITFPTGFDSLAYSSSTDFQEEMYNSMGVESAMNTLLQSLQLDASSRLFYLPASTIQSTNIPSLSGKNRAFVLNLWTRISFELNKSPFMVSVEKIGLLPDTIDLFYDPMEEAVQDDVSMLTLPEASVAAHEFLYSASAIMFRARLANVNVSKCLSMLNHTAAFIFNTIRAHRVEGRELEVSTTFLPFYDQIFKEWTNETDLTNVPVVHPWMVETIYGNDLEPLLYFNATGSLCYIVRVNDGLWALTNLTESLFNETRVAALHELALSNNTTWRIVERKGQSLTGAIQSKWAGVRQSGTTCPSGYITFVNSALQQTPEEECCASVCEDLELILTVGLTSMSECCAICNLAVCSVDDVDLLNGILPITIEQYGMLEQLVISVTI